MNQISFPQAKNFFIKVKPFYKYALLLNALLICFIAYEIFYARYYWDGEKEKKFVIEHGKNLDEIIYDLKGNGIIENEFLFKLAVKLTGNENQIISRSYIFSNGMNNLELIRELTDKNKVQTIRFTIPPGYNLNQIANLAVKKLFLSKEKFLKESENDSLLNLIGLKDSVKNLEGFLFPDTYELPPNIDEKNLVRFLFNEFRKKVSDNKSIQQKLKDENKSLLNVIILASIVKGETQLVEEMPVIAGVYLNRLKKGMRLEADPTIQYILPGGPKPRLLYEDLKIKSPYNTYLNKGLPPGPINNPGMDAIKAALNPQSHNYLFFVATGNGGHKFSENYNQHLDAVGEYRKKMRNKK